MSFKAKEPVMDDYPKTLKEVFEEAESKREALAGTYEASSEGYRQALAVAISDYEECIEIVAGLSIFSPNETAEDIATSDLPYMLLNVHLADLIQKIPTASPQERKHTLSLSREAYERFLHLIDSYDLLQPEYAGYLASYIEDPKTFSTTPSTDPAARRNSKIANHRSEKELQSKLHLLRREPRYLEKDEEAVREVHFANISYLTHQAFQGLEGINREADVLDQAPQPLIPQTTSVEEDDERRRMGDGQQSDAFSERLDPAPPLRRLASALGGPLLTKEGKPLQPFTIVGNRADMAKNVFRPGHNLPTMSIDEYLAEERRRGGIIEGGGEASGRRPEVDEDDMDAADRATMKMREWDEFKEANPKGAGNTLNRG